MASNQTTGFLGLELTSESWLRNHFRAKFPERLKQIRRLPIYSGDRVLDLCCGPGHYAELYAQMVGTSGIVHAIDKDPALIDYAEDRQHHLILGENLKYCCADVASEDPPPIISTEGYHVILFFNCLSYFPDPAEKVSQYAKLLLPGGRLILKDSDFGHILLNPIDQGLKERVIQAAFRSPPWSFDNFFGRRLPGLAKEALGVSPRMDIWSYPMTSPLTPEQTLYISENLMTLLWQGQDLLSDADIAEWTRSFSHESTEGVLEEDYFLFLMHEIVTISEL